MGNTRLCGQHMISVQYLRGRMVCAYVGMVDGMVNSGANVDLFFLGQ